MSHLGTLVNVRAEGLLEAHVWGISHWRLFETICRAVLDHNCFFSSSNMTIKSDRHFRATFLLMPKGIPMDLEHLKQTARKLQEVLRRPEDLVKEGGVSLGIVAAMEQHRPKTADLFAPAAGSSRRIEVELTNLELMDQSLLIGVGRLLGLFGITLCEAAFTLSHGTWLNCKLWGQKSVLIKKLQAIARETDEARMDKLKQSLDALVAAHVAAHPHSAAVPSAKVSLSAAQTPSQRVSIPPIMPEDLATSLAEAQSNGNTPAASRRNSWTPRLASVGGVSGGLFSRRVRVSCRFERTKVEKVMGGCCGWLRARRREGRLLSDSSPAFEDPVAAPPHQKTTKPPADKKVSRKPSQATTSATESDIFGGSDVSGGAVGGGGKSTHSHHLHQQEQHQQLKGSGASNSSTPPSLPSGGVVVGSINKLQLQQIPENQLAPSDDELQPDSLQNLVGASDVDTESPSIPSPSRGPPPPPPSTVLFNTPSLGPDRSGNLITSSGQLSLSTRSRSRDAMTTSPSPPPLTMPRGYFSPYMLPNRKSSDELSAGHGAVLPPPAIREEDMCVGEGDEGDEEREGEREGEAEGEGDRDVGWVAGELQDLSSWLSETRTVGLSETPSELHRAVAPAGATGNHQQHQQHHQQQQQQQDQGDATSKSNKSVTFASHAFDEAIDRAIVEHPSVADFGNKTPIPTASERERAAREARERLERERESLGRLQTASLFESITSQVADAGSGIFLGQSWTEQFPRIVVNQASMTPEEAAAAAAAAKEGPGKKTKKKG